MSNSLSPKRGKLERPAICSASPPPPIPPIVPETYWGSAWVTPHVGYCSDFLLRCRAWSHLIAKDAAVNVTPGPIDWGTITPTGIALRNDNIQRVTHKITNVQDGTHQLPLTFTWAAGRPLEHTYHASVTVTQNCPSSVLINLAAAVWYWWSAPRVSLLAQAWWPNRPDLPTFDMQVETQPIDRVLDRPGEENYSGLRWRDWFTIPAEQDYTFTLRTWWPSFADPSRATTENTLTVHLPSQQGYVQADPWTRDTPVADTVWLLGNAYEEINGDGVPVSLSVSAPGATWVPLGATIPNAEDSQWLGYFSTPPPNGQKYTIDATWPDGYHASWTSRIVQPVQHT